MISLYNFNDFRSFIRERLHEMPKRGYGQSLKLAAFLGVHTTLVSQVLKGMKSFTLEQGALAAEFLGLTDDETEYFLVLIQLDRAGNDALKRSLQRQKEKIRSSAKELVNRLIHETKLSEEKKAVFYSGWIYSAVRQLVAIKGFESLDKIAEHFDLTKKQARQIIDFLLETGLLLEKNGKLFVGPRSTHLESSSPWVNVHHSNWRQKAIGAFAREDATKLHYSCPMTISFADSQKIREQIVKFLESLDGIIEPSPSETLRCLNIDWFEV